MERTFNLLTGLTGRVSFDAQALMMADEQRNASLSAAQRAKVRRLSEPREVLLTKRAASSTSFRSWTSSSTFSSSSSRRLQ